MARATAGKYLKRRDTAPPPDSRVNQLNTKLPLHSGQ